MKPTASPTVTLAERFEVSTRGYGDAVGRDLQTGAPVFVRHPADDIYDRLRDAWIARRVPAITSPHVLPVLLATPKIVHAALPARRPGAVTPLPGPLAVDLALELSEAVAQAHAVGVAGFSIAPSNARLVYADRDPATRPHLCLVLPRLAHGPTVESEPRAPLGCTSVAADVWRVVAFLHSLVEPPHHSSNTWGEPLPAPTHFAPGALLGSGGVDESAAATTLRATLDAILTIAALPPDVAQLARLLAPFASEPAAWAARVAAMPRVSSVAPYRTDWDAMIATFEAADSDGSRWAWSLEPAAAYHQRACARYAAGDLGGALAGAERACALDPYVHYQATRAVVLGARGDVAGMAAAIDVALAGPFVQDRGGGLVDGKFRRVRPAHLARAYYVRAVVRLGANARHEALADLTEAVEHDDANALYASVLERVRATP